MNSKEVAARLETLRETAKLINMYSVALREADGRAFRLQRIEELAEKLGNQARSWRVAEDAE